MFLNNRVVESHQFAADDLIDVIGQAQHNLAQQHVFESCECLAVANAVVALEGLIEVRECSFEVAFVGCMQNSGLKIERGLHFGWAVDGVGSCAGGGQCSASLYKRKFS